MFSKHFPQKHYLSIYTLKYIYEDKHFLENKLALYASRCLFIINMFITTFAYINNHSVVDIFKTSLLLFFSFLLSLCSVSVWSIATGRISKRTFDLRELYYYIFIAFLANVYNHSSVTQLAFAITLNIYPNNTWEINFRFKIKQNFFLFSRWRKSSAPPPPLPRSKKE